MIKPHPAHVTYNAEVDLAAALAEGHLSVGQEAADMETVAAMQNSADISRVYYTDGGVKHGRGTSAFLEVDRAESTASSHAAVLDGLCSSYRAERRALIGVMQKLIKDKIEGGEVIVFTDSLSNLQAL